MNLSKLSLSSREEELLKSMGFDTVEKIALANSYDLGLSKRKAEAIVERARRILAYENIIEIKTSDELIEIELRDNSKAIITSVEYIMSAEYDELKREVKGNKLIIAKLKPSPCFLCGKEANLWCSQCKSFLCSTCQSNHYQHYYVIKSVKELDERFANVKLKAELYTPKVIKQGSEEAALSKEIVEFARGIGFKGFAERFFFELKGNEIMKRAITCALFSTPEEPIHVLIVGDPAGGKTLAKDIITIKLGKEVELIGANTTRAGLVCNLATGELGVLAYSNGKIVLVDEFDKIPEQDVQYCYELLSNGKCSVHSAKIHETIESHFIMIAFANPISMVFRNEPIKEIPIPPILASRFAFIVKVEELSAGLVKDIIKKKLLSESISEEEFSKYCLPWLREAKKYKPRIIASQEAIDAYVDKVYEIYERFLKTPLRRDLRIADYAKRIPIAIARSIFSDVDDGILKEAIVLINESLEAWTVS